MKNIEIKEEGKVKKWVKEHKTGVAVGVTAVAGIGLSALTHWMGYGRGNRDGFKKGYDEGFDNGAEFTMLDLRDSGRIE